MNSIWIAETGSVNETSVKDLVGRFFNGECCFLAGCTDEFCSGKNSINDLLDSKGSALLELRVFTEEKELFVSRSMIGKDFEWRVTDDNNLTEGDYIDSEQFIDINFEKSYKTDRGMHIISTGGGEYELPIEEGDNAVLIRSYVSYDENGMAKVIDFRLRGFGRKW